MANRPFRFVHASDLHLEQPLHGLAETPDHLRELFLEAPYLAAERVFETALAEKADFLLLAGDVLRPWRAGPRGPAFLCQQFERLRERGIAAYWVGGGCDPPQSWPEDFPLPDNVRLFPSGRVEQAIHERDGTALVRILGQSRAPRRRFRASDFDGGDFPTIGLVHARAHATRLARSGVGYWALGGRHGRHTLLASSRMAHHPGSPQGRRPEETGMHGCTLVEVDGQGRARLSPQATDVARWHDERVEPSTSAPRDGLRSALSGRLRAIVAAAPDLDHLVRFTVAAPPQILDLLRRGSWAGELLRDLRNEFGHASPGAWTVTVRADEAPPAAVDVVQQESLLGDFLRTVESWQADGKPLDLSAYLAGRPAAELPPQLAWIDEARHAKQLLRRAAALGCELLSPPAGG